MKTSVRALLCASLSTVATLFVANGAYAQTADVVVDKSAVTTVTELGRVDFLVSVSNSGPETAYGVVLSDLPPPGGSASGSATLQYSTGETSSPAGTVFSLGNLAPGQSVNLTLPYLYTTSGTLVNTAVARFTGTDPNPTNNFSSATFAVVNPGAGPSTDLSITKTAPATVDQGSTVSYQVTVTNNGPDTATGVVIRDPIPTGASFLQTTATQGIPTFDPLGYVELQAGTLAPAQSVTLYISVRADESGLLTNVASFTADQPSSALVEDNSAVAITSVSGPVAVTCTEYQVNFAGAAYSKCNNPRNGSPHCRIKSTVFVTNVTNQVAEATNMSFYLSADPVYDVNDFALGVRKLKKLNPGATAKIVFNAKLPIGVTPAGFEIGRVECIHGGHSEDSTPVQPQPSKH